MRAPFDSSGRRNRLGKVQKHPSDPENVDFEKRDEEWLAFLHRHGGRLPTPYFVAFSSPEYTNYKYTTQRLKLLRTHFNYLYRSEEQHHVFKPDHKKLIHEITKAAERKLMELGRYSRYSPRVYGAYPHQVTGSCISASWELNCRTHGIPYKTQDVFLGAIKKSPRIFISQSEAFQPDEITEIDEGENALLLFHEWDRGTEAGRATDPKRRDYAKIVRQYKWLIGERDKDTGHKRYRDIFKTPEGQGALVLFTTSSHRKYEQMKRIIAEDLGDCKWFLLRYLPEFADGLAAPDVLDMLTTPWERVGHTAYTFA